MREQVMKFAAALYSCIAVRELPWWLAVGLGILGAVSWLVVAIIGVLE